MSHFETIKSKLEAFINKYYVNELIKGAILFFAIGLLYFITTLFIEYILWLNPTGRTILFWLFVIVEAFLFFKFIATPLAQLFKLKKGIDYQSAANIIGEHFPEVDDKLINVLQLSNNSDKTELLLASIEQKSLSLRPVPFKLAINFNRNTKYLKYAAIPLAIVALSLVTGKINWFSDSYERIVNYQTAYEPPAPFQFFVVNEQLQAIENQDYTLNVIAQGEIVPDDVMIVFNDQSYFMKQIQPGEYQYVFSQPKNDISFYVNANNVNSRNYRLEVVETPTLLSLDLFLDYPSHTNKQDELLKSAGNAVVPQGTRVTWKLKTKATDRVTLQAQDSSYVFAGTDNIFELQQRLFRNFEYSINTSNSELENYESLAFKIDVVRDEYPEINVQMQKDSTDNETLYFYGQVSDDYGLKQLELVYYPSENEDDEKRENINIANGAFSEFVNTFPNQLNLQEGTAYELYFQITDNDAVSGFKTAKSNRYSFRKLTADEREQNQLNEQNETIENISESLDKFEEQDQQLKELSKTQKEKSELNFNDQKKLENFLKRQMQQEELMQNFNKKLQDNLEEFQNENEEDKFKEDLQERLEENQEQLKKDEELLKELQKLADKINKEELAEKLEQLAKQNKNKKRSMEQLLELTKRYYVSKKAEKLKNELDKMAKEQEELSDKDQKENTKEKQDELNKKFEDFEKELDELRKDNEELKQPMPLPKDKKDEEEIKKEQKEASENLQQEQPEENQEGEESPQETQQQMQKQNAAQKNQKKAAQKMKKLSEKMNQMMSGGAQNQMSEDIEALRQILDNLVLFSFDQEDLMNTFKSIQINHNEYAKNLIKQQTLREHFEHVDDSLFALSLRQPMISERINREITEVYFNIDKSLGQFSENRIYQGVAAQQYTVTSANALASFLSDVLDNMEMQMNPSPGKGQGDQQLPDIIMSQEQLNEQMQEQMEKLGEESKEGKPKEEGEEGEQKKGQNQDGEQQQEGEGNPSNEELNGELFEIYKQQQQIRQALEDRLAKDGNKGQAKQLLKQMEDVELDLINKGFTNKTLEKMMRLQHQLLKLENATFQQGEDNKRKSRTNTGEFNNTTNKQTPDAKKYFNTIEILNRQALPLQQNYKQKVQDYFKKKNDNF